MNALIGDCGFAFNGTYTYPNCSGMYHYAAESCDYKCLAVEYTFWAVSAGWSRSNFCALQKSCFRKSTPNDAYVSASVEAIVFVLEVPQPE